MKTILVGHRDRSVRDRFRAALADARHLCVAADAVGEVMQALADAARPVDLIVLDLGLSEEGPAILPRLRRADGMRVPVAVFSGSIGDAGDIAQLASAGIEAYINEHAATAQILPALAPHLFPDNFNRRSSTRVTLGVPVSYRTSQTIAGAVTLDVGKGGLAVRTMNPPKSGEGVTLKFRLPGSASDLEALGRVAWSDRKVGMGVQFELVNATDQAALDAFIDEHDEPPDGSR
ncbi:MAG TPA: PilZ domain-containing protein [Vicinamibacterales bacterium]|nr:PilZ domain-containing protein [Vicinamibacterales bacterium]